MFTNNCPEYLLATVVAFLVVYTSSSNSLVVFSPPIWISPPLKKKLVNIALNLRKTRLVPHEYEDATSLSRHTRVQDLASSHHETARGLYTSVQWLLMTLSRPLCLRPGRSCVVTDLLEPLELPRLFPQDLPVVQAGPRQVRSRTCRLRTHSSCKTLLSMYTATKVIFPEATPAPSLQFLRALLTASGSE